MISRCPSCAAQVAEEDSRCPACHWDFAGFKHIPPAGSTSNPTLSTPADAPAAALQLPGLPKARGRADAPAMGPGFAGSEAKPQFPTFGMAKAPPAAPPPIPVPAPVNEAPPALAQPQTSFPQQSVPRPPAAEFVVPDRLKRRSSMDRSVTKELRRRFWGADPMNVVMVAAFVVAAVAVLVVKVTLRSDDRTGGRSSGAIFVGSSGVSGAAAPVPAPAPAPVPAAPALAPPQAWAPPAEPVPAAAPIIAPAPAPAAAPAPPAPLALAPRPRVEPQSWVFEGEVYDGIFLRPVSFAQLVFKGADGAVAAEVVTRENGRYRAVLPAAASSGYTVTLIHPDYAPNFMEDVYPPLKTMSEAERKAVLGTSPVSRTWKGSLKASTKKNLVAVPLPQR